MRLYMKRPKWWQFWKKPEAILIIDRGDRIIIDRLFVGSGCKMKCKEESWATIRDYGELNAPFSHEGGVDAFDLMRGGIGQTAKKQDAPN